MLFYYDIGKRRMQLLFPPGEPASSVKFSVCVIFLPFHDTSIRKTPFSPAPFDAEIVHEKRKDKRDKALSFPPKML